MSIPQSVSDADPLGTDAPDVDLNDQRVGALVIYGSMSNIDMVQTTPEVFWAIFGTPNGRPGTVKWLDNSIRKLTEIEQGMPK
jgi:hypothetical protein